MTIEERFERIEHFTAGWVEQFRLEREENRQIWRETQRHINDLGRKIADTNDAIARLADETREADKRLAEKSRAADERLRERIEALVLAIGKILPRENPLQK